MVGASWVISRPAMSTVNWYEPRAASASTARVIASRTSASPPRIVGVDGGAKVGSGYGSGFVAIRSAHPRSTSGTGVAVGEGGAAAWRCVGRGDVWTVAGVPDALGAGVACATHAATNRIAIARATRCAPSLRGVAKSSAG